MSVSCLVSEKQHPDIHVRLKARRPAYQELDDDKFNILKQAFKQTHCWVNGEYVPFDSVFLYNNNTVVPEPIELFKFLDELGTTHTKHFSYVRQKQLNSILLTGIPMLISRSIFSRWGKNKLTDEEQSFKDFFGHAWFFHFDHTKKDYANESQ